MIEKGPDPMTETGVAVPLLIVFLGDLREFGKQWGWQLP